MSVIRIGSAALLALLLVPAAFAQSLAPPHAPLVAGLTVPVTAHPDQLSLLDSEQAAIAANKRLVFDYWRTVIAAGRVDSLADYLAPDYVEHNPLRPSGFESFKDYVTAHSEAAPVQDTLKDLVTIVAEGAWVALSFVTHYPEADGSGSYTSTHFELFRLEDGRIAEHWDSTLFRAGQQVPDYGPNAAVPTRGVAGAAQLAFLASEDPELFVNKRLVFDLWRQIPEAGLEELMELYMDPIYIQHNPNATTGREGAREYFSRRPDTPVSAFLEAPLVALIAEGDLVVQVLETEREQNGVNYQVPWFDMFRVADGRVIEHWDTASKGELPPIMQQGLQ